jgi:hypothetical protein
MLYLDWGGFGQLIVKAGGEFGWGSERDVGRARAMSPSLRPPIIRGRLPKISFGGAVAYVTDPNLFEMFFDGVTPWSMAQNIVGEMREVIERHQRSENSGGLRQAKS